MPAVNLTRLPEPTDSGSYWFGVPCGNTPAIFRSFIGGWIVQLGAQGMVWEGTHLREFATPEEALKELRRRLK